MKRTLVTGATGFVGANLAMRLLRDGYDVHLLVRPGSDRWRIAPLERNAPIYEVDLEDEVAVRRAVRAIEPAWIFHLAAHGAYAWQTDERRIVQTNVVGLLNLLDACLDTGFETFINTGSSSEYGFKDHPAAETELPEPNSYYAVAKTSATLLCRYVANAHGARIPTLRLYSVYGPYEQPGRLIPTLAACALEGSLPPLVAPAIARDFVFVDDVCDAYLLAAQKEHRDLGSVYNVGTGVQTTLAEAVAIARDVLSLNVEPHWGSMSERDWDTTVWIADARKIRTALGWRPRHSFEGGFQEVVEWLRSRPDFAAMYRERALARACPGSD